MDEHEAQTLADIDRFGGSVLKVSSDRGPDFADSWACSAHCRIQRF